MLIFPFEKSSRNPRGLFFLHVPEDILHLTVQRITQRIERFRADSFTVLHAVDRIGGKALPIDQIIFRNTLFKQCLVKGRITNHPRSPQKDSNIIHILTMLNILTIIEMRKQKKETGLKPMI